MLILILMNSKDLHMDYLRQDHTCSRRVLLHLELQFIILVWPSTAR